MPTVEQAKKNDAKPSETQVIGPELPVIGCELPYQLKMNRMCLAIELHKKRLRENEIMRGWEKYKKSEMYKKMKNEELYDQLQALINSRPLKYFPFLRR